MKKSIPTLAVLATLSFAATAQSTVTLYGRLDTAVTWTDPGSDGQVTDDGGEGDPVFRLNGHDPIGGSRWGLRGTEDLGNGLTARFILESGFQSDTGTGSSRLFDRQAFVALGSASMGEIRLGRQQTLTREVHLLAGDISAEGELTVANSVASNRPLFQNFGTRVDNAIQYVSPNLGAIQIRALVAAGEGLTARQQGAMIGYSSGPLKAAAAYEWYADGPGADGSYNKVVTLGASYDLAFGTLLGSYQNTRDAGSATSDTIEADGAQVEDHDAFNVGVMIPFGSFQLRAQYTKSTIERDGASDLDQDKYGASLRYNVSKRTQLYAVATRFGGDDDETFARQTQFALGMGHNF